MISRRRSCSRYCYGHRLHRSRLSSKSVVNSTICHNLCYGGITAELNSSTGVPSMTSLGSSDKMLQALTGSVFFESAMLQTLKLIMNWNASCRARHVGWTDRRRLSLTGTMQRIRYYATWTLVRMRRMFWQGGPVLPSSGAVLLSADYLT